MAAGHGITTVPFSFVRLPAGVALVRIDGVPEERRHLSVAHRPDLPADIASAVVEALRRVALDTSPSLTSR